ncbi:MAG TPA: hypothetical protein VGR08_14070 [Thermomicrobiales bacterium]|nr:hypothetical protein [Thermomicrobiales bacterium]
MSNDRLSPLNAFSRRDVPRIGIAASLPLALGAFGWSALAQEASTPTADRDTLLPATPAIADDDEVTPDQAEGPFYTPDSPERALLREEGMRGANLTVAGFVVDTGGRTIPDALVDVWHADDAGVYDNEGYRLRGHQFTDAEGRYVFYTIVPGLYPGRTRHIHVKAQAPDGEVLTTQLYFPDEGANSEDGLYDEALLLEMQPDLLDDGSKLALFTFVLDTA